MSRLEWRRLLILCRVPWLPWFRWFLVIPRWHLLVSFPCPERRSQVRLRLRARLPLFVLVDTWVQRVFVVFPFSCFPFSCLSGTPLVGVHFFRILGRWRFCSGIFRANVLSFRTDSMFLGPLASLPCDGRPDGLMVSILPHPWPRFPSLSPSSPLLRGWGRPLRAATYR